MSIDKVINHHNVELNVGDTIKIVSERNESKLLANVDIGDTVTISCFSDDGKILYHHGVLALPVFSDIYVKINP